MSEIFSENGQDSYFGNYRNFFKNFIEQSDWNNYIIDDTLELLSDNNNYNNFSVNDYCIDEVYEIELKNYYSDSIDYSDDNPEDVIKVDNINSIKKITIKIKFKEGEIFNPYFLLTSYIDINRINTVQTKLIYHIFNNLLVKDSLIYNEEENSYEITLFNFSKYQYGILYNNEEFITNVQFSEYFMNKIENVYIKFYGSNYFDKSLLDKDLDYYNKQTIIVYDYDFFHYSRKNNYICNMFNSIGLLFMIIEDVEDTDVYNIKKIENQPILEKLIFKSYDKEEWEYDLMYINIFKIHGFNIYYVPFYPDYINIKNIMNPKKDKYMIYTEYNSLSFIPYFSDMLNKEYKLYTCLIGFNNI